MQFSLSRTALAGMVFALSFFQTSTNVKAETQIRSSVESRVTLGFHVDEAAAQATLPDGWKLFTLPKGPLKGVNLIVSLMDWHLAVGADGKPEDPSSRRAMATVVYGTKEGVKGLRTFITQVYETPPVQDPFSNSQSATIAHDSALEGPADGDRTRKEVWVVTSEGGEMSLRLTHKASTASWSSAESQPYSAVDPDYHEIYRYKQLADLAMSTAIGKPLSGEINFSSTLPQLAALFDGNEELIAALTVPVYVRDTFLP